MAKEARKNLAVLLLSILIILAIILTSPGIFFITIMGLGIYLLLKTDGRELI